MQIGEDGMSVPFLATWPAMGEREKEIFEVEIFWWKCVERKNRNFGKLEIFLLKNLAKIPKEMV